MEDISEKLAELLNDPDSLNRVRAMAEGLLGEQKKEPKKSPDANPISEGSEFDMAQIGKIMSIMSQLKGSNDDNRAKLLLALKPHLSAPRQVKVDTAIKLLKLIDLLPILKDSGLFEF